MQWGSPGVGMVRVEQNINGCTQITEKCVEIIAKPSASIISLPANSNGILNVCLNQNVIFNANVVTSGGQSPYYTYLWDFGQPGAGTANTSTARNPTFTFTNAGIQVVTLTVTNECGCSDVVRIRAIVAPDLAATINCNTPVCAGEKANYSVNVDCPPPAGQYLWTINPPTAGTILPSSNSSAIAVQWSSTAVGPVYLNFQGLNCNTSCNAVSSIEVPILSSNLNIDGDLIVCSNNNSHTYSVPQIPGSVYAWSITNGNILSGQGTNEVVVEWNSNTTYSATGVLDVTYHNNIFTTCSDGSGHLVVQIRPELTITSGPQSICTGVEPQYQTAPNVQLTWRLLDANGVLVYSTGNPGNPFTLPLNSLPGITPGNYVLIASHPNYCNSAKVYLTILAPPVAVTSITGNSVVCPGNYELYSASAINSFYKLKWSVSGGALTAIQGAQTSVTWNAPLPANASVAVTQMDEITGCESTPLTLNIQGRTFNSAALQPISGCINGEQDYVFTNVGITTGSWTITPANLGSVVSSTISGNDVTIHVQWNNTAGSGTLSLESTTCGATNPTVNIPLNVQSIGALTITSNSPICQNSNAVFTINGLTAADYLSLDYGDNTNSYAANYSTGGISHSYAAASSGTGFLVQGEAITANGCKLIGTANIVVLPMPEVSLSVGGDVCDNLPPVTVSTLANPNYTYQWSGSASVSNTINAVPGTSYTVTVTNSNTGCTASSNISVPACSQGCTGTLPGVTAILTSFALSGAQCGTVQCTLSISGLWSSYTLSCGSAGTFTETSNGSTSQQFVYDLVFNSAGDHALSLIVTNGSTTSPLCLQENFIVNVPLTASIDESVSCPVGSLYGHSLNANTFIGNPSYSVSNYSWSIDDGTLNVYTFNSSSATSSIAYIQPAFYTTTLVMTAVSGYHCFVNDVLNAESAPIPNFTATNSCVNLPVFFTGGSLSYTSSNWDFDDGSTYSPLFPLSDNDAVRTYSSAGLTYDVVFTATDKFGCSYSQLLSFLVNENNLGGSISPLSSSSCAGAPIQLTYQQQNYPTPSDFLWSNGSTASSTWASSTGTYSLTISQQSTGCKKELLLSSNILILDIPAPLIIGNANLCVGTTTELKCVPANGYTYLWSSPDLNIVNATSSVTSLNAPAAGIYTIAVTISDAQCSRTTSIPVIANAPPPTFDVTLDPAPACEGYINQLTAQIEESDPNLYTLTWSNGQHGNPINTFLPGPVTATYTDSRTGCLTTSSATVFPKTDLSWVLSGCFEICQQDQNMVPTTFTLHGSNMFSYKKWEWWIDNGMVSDGTGLVNDYTFTPAVGVYTIRLHVIDGNDCIYFSDPLTLTVVDCSCRFTIDNPSNIFNTCLGTDIYGLSTGTFQLNLWNTGNVPGTYTFQGLSPNALNATLSGAPSTSGTITTLNGFFTYQADGNPVEFTIIFTGVNPKHSCEQVFTIYPQTCPSYACDGNLQMNQILCVGQDNNGNTIYEVEFAINTTSTVGSVINLNTMNGYFINYPLVTTGASGIYHATYIDPAPQNNDPVCIAISLMDMVSSGNPSMCYFNEICFNRPRCPLDPIGERVLNNLRLNSLQLEVFPNPASQNSTIAYQIAGDQGIITIYNSQMQLINKMGIGNKRGIITLDLNGYPAGLYFLELTDRLGGRKISKLLISK